MKRSHKLIRRLALAIAVFVLASGGIFGGYRALTRTVSELQPLTAVIQPQDFTLTISANGELQSAESLAIAVPPVPVQRLRIASVVADGTHVNKGDVLVEFDPEEIDLQLMAHRSDLEMALQKITRGGLASEVEKSDVVKDKKIAELELEKIIEFLPTDEQIYKRREIIEGKLDKDYTEKKIVFADARLQLKGKVYSLDEAILMIERGQATAQITRSETALASLKLISPASGIVVYNDPGYFFGGYTLMPGRTVYVGMTLFNLVNPDKMEAKCYVLEKDAGELRAAQSVTVVLDPYPGVEFTGKVKTIDKLARPVDRESPVKYFQTVVSLDKADPLVMKPGVKLKAEISAGELKSAIVVPRSAAVKKDSSYVAYVQRAPGKFEPVPVTLGQGNVIQVVVTEGLEPGQILALNPPDVKQDFSDKARKTNGDSAKPK
ncbi:MAG TPA: HlyD family efflux transporter periplasmic adaptor subunit [Blastocatellia bacterium]|jgi:multidrug efflux pump subunit AcrA (membrane-fusion protein)|nr:HlyD family efflux transporter periplasmic adaptor subunit [Blastocatellia bacterium]